MSMIRRFMSRLPSAWDASPGAVKGLQFGATGDFTWLLADDALTLTPAGGAAVTIALGTLSISDLAAQIAATAGFFVRQPISAAVQAASALTLMAGSGSVTGAAAYAFPAQSRMNTVAVSGVASWCSADYPFQQLNMVTNPNWALLDILRSETEVAAASVLAAPAQMCVPTAEGEWLDYLGSVFGGIGRDSGESDALYGPRIIATILRPACNNKAIELAILNYTGQTSRVTDAVNAVAATDIYNGANAYNGGIEYSSSLEAPEYCLFDLAANYDPATAMQGPTDFEATLRAMVNSLRAAGTFLRNLVVDPDGPTYEDTDVATQDGQTSLTLGWSTAFNGARNYDGSATYLGDGTTTEELE